MRRTEQPWQTLIETYRLNGIDPFAWLRDVRLILDGTVVRVRRDRKATVIALLVVLVARGPKTPEFLIVDGAAGV